MYVANINKIFDSYMKQCENVSKLLFTEKHILSSYSVLTMLDMFVQPFGPTCPIDWTRLSSFLDTFVQNRMSYIPPVHTLRASCDIITALSPAVSVRKRLLPKVTLLKP